MLKHKVIFALGATFLFIALAMIPASATYSSETLRFRDREQSLVNRLFYEIELLVQSSENYLHFLRNLRDLCNRPEFDGFPILKEIISKILAWIARERIFPIVGGNNNNGLFDKLSGGLFKGSSSENFVISRGSYNRLRPNKANTLFKQGFAFLRYRGGSKLIKDKTLIITRKPFGFKQRVTGTHIVFMTGFRGLFIDIESQLTGNAYTLVMGRAHRARAFKNPFSQ